MQKVIIDTDPGVDDAMAVIYAALSPEIEVVGLTSIFGNVPIDVATRNALALAEMTGLDVPVATGAGVPVEQPLQEPATDVHGKEGFGDVEKFSPKRQPISQTAAEFICEMVNRFPGEIVLCPVGPLTNIALALRLDPSIAQKVKGVTVMGGSVDEGGNVTPHAEANIWQDPHAANEVFAANWPVTMVGLDVTHQIICTPEDFAACVHDAPKLGGFLNEAAQFYFQFHRKVDGIHGCHMHDPAAVISIVKSHWFEIDAKPIEVIVEGEEIGRTRTAEHLDRPKIGVCAGVDADAVREEFLSMIKSGN